MPRSLLVLLRPALGFGLLLGLTISGMLAIPWFGGSAVDPARTPRAEVEAAGPAGESAPAGSEPAREAEPPLPPAQPPLEIAALVPDEAPVYRPSADLAGGSLAGVRSEPVIRAGVASRLPEIRALGPEHVGATAVEAPALYWFLSGESSAPVEITLTADQAEAPLLALRLEPPVGAGLHALRLQRHGIRLAPGVIHRWVVALAPDPAEPRLQAGAAVRRAAAAGALREQLAAAAPQERAHLLASGGYWYDAFETLTEWIQAEPSAQRLREHRAALLEQVGLAGVAGLLSAPAPPSSAAAGP
jgi:hypothetical protein